MDADEYATKYVKDRPQVYDVRIKHAWLDDPKIQFDLDGEECRAFLNLMRWTESQHSDGCFDRKYAPMVRHLTDERLDRMIAVGVVEEHGDGLRIADPYRSWQSTFEEKKAAAVKQYNTNERVRKHREQQGARVLTAVPTAAEAIKQARATGDVTPLKAFGFTWYAPDVPDGMRSPTKVRAWMREQKMLWLDDIQKQLETA